MITLAVSFHPAAYISERGLYVQLGLILRCGLILRLGLLLRRDLH
jgi:hypothetical protein